MHSKYTAADITKSLFPSVVPRLRSLLSLQNKTISWSKSKSYTLKLKQINKVSKNKYNLKQTP